MKELRLFKKSEMNINGGLIQIVILTSNRKLVVDIISYNAKIATVPLEITIPRIFTSLELNRFLFKKDRINSIDLEFSSCSVI